MSIYRIGIDAAIPRGLPGGSSKRHRSPRRSETSGGAEAFQAVCDKLTKWIPGDALAIYLPGVTLLGASGKPSALFLIVMILLTPLLTLGFAFSIGAPLGRRVPISATLAAVAFAIWSLSVPMSGWQSLDVVANNTGAVAVGAAICGILFGYVAEGVVKRLDISSR